MQPHLKAFLDEDEGYKQFCERFDYFSATPEERDRFISWQLGAMRQEGMFMAAEERGREQKAIATATRLLDMGMPVDKITQATKLPIEIILSLKTNP
ncbi:MAG: hypothetical protein FWG65_10475 [Turicibacter sp.]|nr:hypothetical protein [Turicibacter sp.]